jgi:phosphatidylglycerol:prolipoprotein diacylglycerol transferase
VLAAIPYTTFPTIELGPLTLRTFGLMVALGVLIGSWIAAAYAERFGVARDETYRVATWMVLAGIIGSRLTWAATHTDQIDNVVDVIAIWEGGIQFSGGFIFAIIVGLPFFRRWGRVQRWRVLDGYALGLSLGLAFGRVGCYAVGEHFGRTTDFFLASRYDGGEVREPLLGDVPLTSGTTFHNTALYELLYLLAIFVSLAALVWGARRRGREVSPGTLTGIFVLVYGVCRLISDSFRVNDERVAGMTGAQWMSLVMIVAGAWILWKVRPRMARLAEEEPAVAGVEVPDEPEASGAEGPDGDADGADESDAPAGAEAGGDDAASTAADGGGEGARSGRDGSVASTGGEGERWRSAASRMSALLDRSSRRGSGGGEGGGEAGPAEPASAPAEEPESGTT